MTGATIRLPKPHAGQRVVLMHPARFKWVSAGRRWRKTMLGVSAAIEKALKGKTIFWGGPTYDQCRVGWGELYKAAGGAARFNLSRMEAGFPTGGKVIFRSLDNPENARGHTADLIILDEAALLAALAYYEVLRPVISDTQGELLALFTPKGRNWVWQESLKAADSADSAFWQAPTLGVEVAEGGLIRKPHPMENPDFPFEEAVSLYETMTERAFRQEFLAEFVEDGGGVFRNVMACASAVALARGEAGRLYTYGVDWGKHHDFTAIVVMDGKRQVYLDRFNKIDYAVQVGRLKALCERFPPRVIIAEANAMGEPLIEQLQREGLPVRGFAMTSASKTPLIDALTLAFEKKDIAVLNEPALIAELQAYEMQRLPSGSLRYSAPEGVHDDCVVALALAWSAINQPRVALSEVNPFYTD